MVLKGKDRVLDHSRGGKTARPKRRVLHPPAVVLSHAFLGDDLSIESLSISISPKSHRESKPTHPPSVRPMRPSQDSQLLNIFSRPIDSTPYDIGAYVSFTASAAACFHSTIGSHVEKTFFGACKSVGEKIMCFLFMDRFLPEGLGI